MAASATSLDVAGRRERDEGRTLLRFITCGNVDDGKSSLIGRLLHDSGSVPEDEFSAVTRDSERWGTTGKAADLALLVDGLQAEREQGITIDVAYRYFDTPRRKFILADTPGHPQYTRNMATGASTADLAIVVVDALKGVSAQTRRHAMVANLFGIRHLVIAITKMDAVQNRREVFESVRLECLALLRELGSADALFIPLSALTGDNVVHRLGSMPWYQGPTLLAYLEAIDTTQQEPPNDLRLPVQLVLRPDAGFRGYAGTVQAGALRVGDDVLALPSRRATRVRSILVAGRDQGCASRGDSITLTLEDEIDLVRGDVLVHPMGGPAVTDTFDAHIVWMSDIALLPGRQYDLKLGHRYVTGHVERIEHRIDMARFERQEAKQLEFNEIALCRIVTTSAVVIDTYARCRAMGSLIFIDRLTQATVGAGMILRNALHPGSGARGDTYDYPTRVTREMRSNQKGQRPRVVWFTGLSGSGKSTIANALEEELFRRGLHSYLLDGDNLRTGLSRDLDFSAGGRAENIRRAGEVAKLMSDAGLIVITAFISPFVSDRALARQLIGDAEFLEVYLSASLAICEARDPKGLYVRARDGKASEFTGISSPYEPPAHPALTIDTGQVAVPEAVASIIALLGLN